MARDIVIIIWSFGALGWPHVGLGRDEDSRSVEIGRSTQTPAMRLRTKARCGRVVARWRSRIFDWRGHQVEASSWNSEDRPDASTRSQLFKGFIARSNGFRIGRDLVGPLTGLEPILAALFEPAASRVGCDPGIEEI